MCRVGLLTPRYDGQTRFDNVGARLGDADRALYPAIAIYELSP
jgi:hypothetical protein